MDAIKQGWIFMSRTDTFTKYVVATMGEGHISFWVVSPKTRPDDPPETINLAWRRFANLLATKEWEVAD